MNDEQHKAAMAFAQAMIDQEYKFQRENNPERFAKCTAEYLRKYEEDQRAKALEIAERILAREKPLWNEVRLGRFHPSNTHSRKLFEAVTGEKLPRGANDTSEALAEYIGRDNINRWAEERRDAEATKEAERKAVQAAKEAEYFAALKDQVSEGEPIRGDELVDLAKHLGVKLHPRTVGMLRKRVVSVNSSKAKITGKGNVKSAYSIYSQCERQLCKHQLQ